MKRSSLLAVSAATIAIASCCLLAGCSTLELFNPFHVPQQSCVPWHSLNPVDTTHSSTVAVAHPDSVCRPVH